MKASELAYTALREDIVEWRLAPGEVLGEVEQAARLGVSRTPLREAMKQLMADGLLEPHAGRGVVVSHVTEAQVDALFEARLALDTASAALAARRGDRAVFGLLAREFAQAEQGLADGNAKDSPSKTQRYYELIAELDRRIDEAADNPYLERAQVPLKANLARLRRATKEQEGRLQASAAEHASIARAIAAGNPELAAAATHIHLDNARRAIADAVTRLDPPAAAATAQSA
jgi:DNA-binding GntR family transcriptional regulator